MYILSLIMDLRKKEIHDSRPTTSRWHVMITNAAIARVLRLKEVYTPSL